MEYSNAPEVEGVNAEEGRGEGREFAFLATTFLTLAALATFLFLRVGAVLGPLVPFSWEQRAVPNFAAASLSTDDVQTQQRLQALAERAAQAMNMPNEMTITVHYVAASTQNAFATLGGHVFIFEGLLSTLKHEETVAALLAHELAHVKHRHVIKGATGSIMLGVMWATLGFGSEMAVQIGNLGQAAKLPMLSRTRAMEREADREALNASLDLYGHAGGYFALFDALGALPSGADVPNLLRSHPKVADRAAVARGRIPAAQRSGTLTPW